MAHDDDLFKTTPPWEPPPPCPRCGSEKTQYHAVPFVSLQIYARCTVCEYVWACGPFTPGDSSPTQ